MTRSRTRSTGDATQCGHAPAPRCTQRPHTVWPHGIETNGSWRSREHARHIMRTRYACVGNVAPPCMDIA